MPGGLARSLAPALFALPVGFAGLADHFAPAPLLLIFAFWSLAGIPSQLLHEAGHAMAARLTGGFAYAIHWGEGEVLRVFRIGLTRLEVAGPPLRAMSTTMFWPPERATRWAKGLAYMGGAIANLLAALVALAVMFALGRALESHLVLACALVGVLLQQLWGMSTLWPRWTAGAAGMSDGMQLWRLLRPSRPRLFDPDEPAADDIFIRAKALALTEANRFSETLHLIRPLAEDRPDNGEVYALLLNAIAKTEGHQAVVEEVRRSRPELFTGQSVDPDWRFATLNLAWSALLTDDPDLLPIADQLSHTAWSQDALDAATRMTRGAVLAATGQRLAGIVMMTEALPGVEPLADKAECAPRLARALAAEGDAELAAGYEAQSRYLARRLAKA